MITKKKKNQQQQFLLYLNSGNSRLTIMKKKRNFERKRKTGGERGYIDVVTDGIELGGGFLVEPIGSDLVEYLIHFGQQRLISIPKELLSLSLFFLQIKKKEREHTNVMEKKDVAPILILSEFFVTLDNYLFVILLFITSFGLINLNYSFIFFISFVVFESISLSQSCLSLKIAILF